MQAYALVKKMTSSTTASGAIRRGSCVLSHTWAYPEILCFTLCTMHMDSNAASFMTTLGCNH